MIAITFSTNKQDLNIPFIHTFITETFWAKGRTIKETKTCINKSLNFGIFLNKEQIGNARVVTELFSFCLFNGYFYDTLKSKKG
jgi:hypothetical protein